MSSHLSEGTIKDYLESKIAADELLSVDDHLAECDVCSQSILSKAEAADLSAGTIDLDTVPSHLPFEVLESIANASIDTVEKEIAEVHLERCDACRENLNQLIVLQKELEGPTVRPLETETKEGIWQNVSAFLKPAYLIPALAILLFGVIGIWWYATNQTSSVEQSAVPAVNDISPPANGSTMPPSDVNANQQTEAPQQPPVVASVNDGGTKIELYSDGKISGLASSQFEGRVRNALAKQEIAIPADARELARGPGVLMSGAAEGVPFALSSPVGKTLETAAPRLVWKPLARADSYRVEVFDENFNRVASSPTQKATSWQIDRPLQRGRTYVWQVTATNDGIEAKSPVRPAPDAKFKIIGQAAADSITAAKRSGNSRLVLGLLYAEAGMLAEAEREFAALLRANPDSSVVRSLLQKVRSAR